MSNWPKTVFRVLLIVLAAKVFISILLEYRWYFPADFDHSAFLVGRRHTFAGFYSVAFYAHILASPCALLSAAMLMVSGFRKWRPTWHRRLGKLQLIVFVPVACASGFVMAQQAYGGTAANLGFSSLAVFTVITATVASVTAMRRQFAIHKIWAIRNFLLLASPLLQRIGGGFSIVSDHDTDLFYALNSWLSWLIPLAAFECWHYSRKLRAGQNGGYSKINVRKKQSLHGG